MRLFKLLNDCLLIPCPKYYINIVVSDLMDQLVIGYPRFHTLQMLEEKLLDKETVMIS